MTRCTWDGCADEAKHDKRAKDGAVWARLCDEHDARFNAAAGSQEPGKILAVWVKAQGGAKAATARMLGRTEGTTGRSDS